MTDHLNFDSHPTKGTAAAERLGAALASYADADAFAASRAWTRQQARGRILEVGPGLGETTGALTAAGADIYWMDASSHFAAAAALAAPGRGAVAELTRSAWRTGVFDTVIADRVLHHISDTSAALAELRRVTRPGGRCVLTLPDIAGQRHDGPEAYNTFIEARCEPGRFTAAPDAVNIITRTAGDAGWLVEPRVTFTLTDHDILIRYTQLLTLANANVGLTDEATAALLEWATNPDSYWEFDLVGITLTAL